jgi:hypothetical protein
MNPAQKSNHCSRIANHLTAIPILPAEDRGLPRRGILRRQVLYPSFSFFLGCQTLVLNCGIAVRSGILLYSTVACCILLYPPPPPLLRYTLALVRFGTCNPRFQTNQRKSTLSGRKTNQNQTETDQKMNRKNNVPAFSFLSFTFFPRLF